MMQGKGRASKTAGDTKAGKKGGGRVDKKKKCSFQPGTFNAKSRKGRKPRKSFHEGGETLGGKGGASNSESTEDYQSRKNL